MFDHVALSVSDYAKSKAFFLKALAPLGVASVFEGPLGIELCRPNSISSLCIRRTPEQATYPPLHLAFTAETREQVHEFYRLALEAGGTDNGAPGVRPQYSGSYYAAFVIAPDGHNVEAVCHQPDEVGKSVT
ncbi:MAG TPA: VOC family protein [Rubrivivax sp.]|jgi:catechol 2,3-dioxygenase-like lactoylglutathione lyase family enzyme|nr:VOC family protein [Rubrivivax sp.]